MVNKKLIPIPEPSAQTKILDAARAEFVAVGFKSARMQSIARKAGVNHALLHYYFHTKEKLCEAAARETMRTLWGAMRDELKNVPEKGDFETLLVTLLKTHARIISRHPDFPMFFLRGMLEEGNIFSTVKAELFQTFSEVPSRVNQALQAEIKAGRLRPIALHHFWLNLVGMTVSGFLAFNLSKRLEGSPLSRIRFTEKFFLERAEVIAATVIQSLRIEKEPA